MWKLCCLQWGQSNPPCSQLLWCTILNNNLLCTNPKSKYLEATSAKCVSELHTNIKLPVSTVSFSQYSFILSTFLKWLTFNLSSWSFWSVDFPLLVQPWIKPVTDETLAFTLNLQIEILFSAWTWSVNMICSKFCFLFCFLCSPFVCWRAGTQQACLFLRCEVTGVLSLLFSLFPLLLNKHDPEEVDEVNSYLTEVSLLYSL